ncbi:MAG: hypothetical protein HYS08_06770 [Chlamydiae bacterium]|nr:hypothetical protein [Chlamydiota bacterium]MBI3267053.1 hypothetical protein [Chlamydiota bacterium]
MGTFKLDTRFGIILSKVKISHICHNLPPESTIEGLLGLDFLKKAKVILDFSKGMIEIP